MTSTDVSRAISDLTKQGGALDLGHDRARLLIRIFRLLSQGRPVSRDQAEEAIADLGVDRTQARRSLESWSERNDDGDIVGLGLTYNPTAHQVTIGDARMWAWCAVDTLIFAVVLDEDVTVESKGPGTSEIVRLQVGPGGVREASPAGAVVTHPARSSDQVDLSSTAAIWGTFCHHSFFFPSRTQAEQWASGRDDIVVLSLDDGFAVAREEAGAMLRYEPEQEQQRS